ncbi:MAG: hypothetical protein ACRDPF_14455 [Streptosporangiaceae bacterium]
MDDGFSRAPRTGRLVMKPGIDRFDGPRVRFARPARDACVHRRQARQLARAITG